MIRPYRPEDREGCLRVLDSNVPEYFLASDREEVGAFLDRLEDQGVHYLVVEEEGAIVACGGVAVSATKDARMCWGMVRRDVHRRGLGRMLLAARLIEGAKMGAVTSSLATIPAVEGFFAKLGFELVGSEKDHYAPGWDRRDNVITLDEATLGRLRLLANPRA
jgi:N-acetylglutamate synthase-like GNAT family acetyltransferase